jgi:TolB protein
MHRLLVLAILASLALSLARQAPPAEAGQGGSGRFIYTAGTFEDNIGVYSANVDASRKTRLSGAFWSFDGQPVYSPNGQRIATHSRRGWNDLQIYVMNADGSDSTRITNNEFFDASPAWSPDGSRIAFDSLRSAAHDIYVINVDGTGERRLTTDSAHDEFPTWSPDGKKIAFQSDRNGDYDIFIMDADGTDPRRITGGQANDITPDWSPDGRQLLFVRQDGEDYSIMKINVDGTGEARLSGNAGPRSGPDWSPDGGAILFSNPEHDKGDIWIMDADGSDERSVISTDEPEEYPDWAPARCVVASVIDGDTFTCVGGSVVDLLQIDAPELGVCGGEWAHAALANIFLTPGRTVTLEFDTITADGAVLAAPIARGTDGADYNISIVMAYVGLARAAMIGSGNTKYLDWASASEGWAAAAQWNMWAPGKPFTGGC